MSWSIPLLTVLRSPPSGSAETSPPESCLVPYSVGLHCLPAGSSGVFELENHSKFCIPLKSVVFRALCSILHGFKWKKKNPWSMETVGNWNSSFPRVVSSCSLQMNFPCSAQENTSEVGCTETLKVQVKDTAPPIANSWKTQLSASTPLLISAPKPLSCKRIKQFL